MSHNIYTLSPHYLYTIQTLSAHYLHIHYQHNSLTIYSQSLLQGIPIGLKTAMPLILTKRGVPYTDQAIFTIATYPFSMKVTRCPPKLGLTLTPLARCCGLLSWTRCSGPSLAGGSRGWCRASISSVRQLVLYCTVLYCTVLYCTVCRGDDGGGELLCGHAAGGGAQPDPWH